MNKMGNISEDIFEWSSGMNMLLFDQNFTEVSF